MNKLTREFSTKMEGPPLLAEREAKQRELLREQCLLLCEEIEDKLDDDSVSITMLEHIQHELQNLVDGL